MLEEAIRGQLETGIGNTLRPLHLASCFFAPSKGADSPCPCTQPASSVLVLSHMHAHIHTNHIVHNLNGSRAHMTKAKRTSRSNFNIFYVTNLPKIYQSETSASIPTLRPGW